MFGTTSYATFIRLTDRRKYVWYDVIRNIYQTNRL